MKDKASISHDEVMVKKLRKDRAFAAEYLKAAMEDTEEPQVAVGGPAARCRSARGRGQNRQGGGNRTGKPLPRPVAARQSAALHPRRGDESNGLDTHGRDFPSARVSLRAATGSCPTIAHSVRPERSDRQENGGPLRHADGALTPCPSPKGRGETFQDALFAPL